MAAKKKTATKKTPVQTEKMVEAKEALKVEETAAPAAAKVKEASAEKTTNVVAEEPSKKAPAKKPAAKRTTKKAVKTSLFVQAAGKEVSMEEAVARVKAAWVATGNKEADLKEIAVYVKPEEASIYYVVNGDITGRVDF